MKQWRRATFGSDAEFVAVVADFFVDALVAGGVDFVVVVVVGLVVVCQSLVFLLLAVVWFQGCAAINNFELKLLVRLTHDMKI